MNSNLKKRITIFILIGILLIIILTGALLYFLVDKEVSYKDDKYLYTVKIANNALKVYSNKLVYNDEDTKYSKASVDKFKKYIADYYDVQNKEVVINYDDLDEYHAMIMLCFMNNLSEAEFEIAIEDYDYSVYLSYEDGYYVIYLKDTGEILVKKTRTSKDGLDILKVVDTYNIEFSKDNSTILAEFIRSLFSDDKDIRQTFKSGYRKDEAAFVKSIINNDESYLNKKNVKLLYSMSFSGIDCLTPTLYLYDDNTFEYYYTFTGDNDVLVPKRGTYDVDINALIAEAADVSEAYAGVYTLKSEETGNVYYINIMTSNAASELLSQTNTPLSICLVQQGYEN